MINEQDNDKKSSYPFDKIEADSEYKALSETHQTIQNERTDKSKIIFTIVLVLAVGVVIWIATIPTIVWQETLVIAGFIIFVLYMIDEILGVKTFKRLINSGVDAYKRRH